MRPSSSSCYFLLLAFFLLSLQSLFPVEAYVEETCRKAASSDPRVNYNFCVNRLYRHHNSGSADDWRLAQIAAELSINNSYVACYHIKQMIRSGRNVDKPALGRCLQLHNQILFAVAAAKDQIVSRNYAAGEAKLNQAVGMARSCEGAFSSAGEPSPLTAFNNESVNLSTLSLAITKLL